MHLYILGRMVRTIPTRMEYEPVIHFEVHDRRLAEDKIPGPSLTKKHPEPSQVAYHFGRPGTALTFIGQWVRGYLKEKGARAPLHLHINGFNTEFEEGMEEHLKAHVNLLIENARLRQQLQNRNRRRTPRRA